MTKYRSVTPFILHLRNLLRGRKIVLPTRYADLMSARTQPQPQLPPGPYDKTSGIYYYQRDGRREVQPPLEVITAKQIVSGSEEKAVKQEFITPGKSYEWC